MDSEQSKKDLQKAMAIHQGYVPSTCSLPGVVVMSLVNRLTDPCLGCSGDRKVCGGRPYGDPESEVAGQRLMDSELENDIASEIEIFKETALDCLGYPKTYPAHLLALVGVILHEMQNMRVYQPPQERKLLSKWVEAMDLEAVELELGAEKRTVLSRWVEAVELAPLGSENQ